MPSAATKIPLNNVAETSPKGRGNSSKTRGLRPTSRRSRLGNLDRRTHEAKTFEAFKAELTEHVGGSPTIVQAAIIERAAWVRLRLAIMDSKVASGTFTDHDSAHYLAWANTLARLLARLGLQPAAAAKPDPMAAIRAYTEARAGAREPAA